MSQSGIVKKLSDAQMAGVDRAEFSVGDTVAVSVMVKEGERERVQVYEGLVIARKSRGFDSSFTVRKISYGEGVERIFPLYSPNVVDIKVKRKGDVNQLALLFAELSGKKARVKQKIEKKKVSESSN